MKSRFITTDEEQTVRIPYRSGPSKNPRGKPNIGYHHMGNGIEQIDLFPEIKGFPALRECLLLLNDPARVFCTLRCDSDMEPHTAPEPFYSCFSMVTIVFRRPPGNEPEWFRYFFDDFRDYRSSKALPDSVYAGFVLNELEFEAEGYKGFCLDVRLSASARTSAEAKALWTKAMQAFQESIIRWDSLAKRQGVLP
jgi:hypothetical protein